MKITVITITYNSSETLADTIKSVLSQTYEDLEYLIIDGKSKDNTLNIIQMYYPLFNGKMKYISEPDKGLYDALNKGLKMSTGDIVGFLHSDDFFTSNDILQKIATEFSDSKLDAVYGDIHFVKPSDLTKCTRYYSSKPFKPYLMRFGFMPAHPSFYCKKSCYLTYGGFDTSYKIAADFENLLRLIYKHKIKIKYIPCDFVTMRMGGASTSGLNSHKQIMKDHLRALKSNGVYSNRFLLSLRYIYKILELIKSKLN